MNVVVVYESVFGNTHAVADAIADGIKAADSSAEITCLHVAAATAEAVEAADLLIVGGPTHARGMSSGMSRRMSLKQPPKSAAGDPLATLHTEPGAAGEGLRHWFARLPKISETKLAAAFDTRVDARFAGGAAQGIARRLRHHGFLLVADPEGFIVADATGPLREGEPARAATWGASVAATVMKNARI